MKPSFLLLPALLLPWAPLKAAVTEVYTFDGLTMAIPDGNPVGLVDNRTIDSSLAAIDTVVITLQISGTFTGDLYAYISHGSGYSVLLNRPGKTPDAPFGYEDDGLFFTFDDAAATNAHSYQSSSVPATGLPATGTFQPDGRTTDPSSVTLLDPPVAMLSSFHGLSGSGDWTLFVADLSGGDPHVVQSWSMALTGTPVPEPSPALVALGSLVWMAQRRVRRRVA